MNTPRRFKILFLCTGNSARSIIAEFLLRKIAPEKFETYSAGSDPKSSPNPVALHILQDLFNIDVSGARSKSWQEFIGFDFDFVVTLCDNAKEHCPVWPGQPVIAHWGSPDPAGADIPEEERANAFWKVAQQINRRLELFASLSFDKLDALRLDASTKAIGDQNVIKFPQIA